MPPKKKTDAADCDCGQLTPTDTDQEISTGAQPQEVLAKIMLLCDDTTGVFFFRHDGSLYLRVVEAS